MIEPDARDRAKPEAVGRNTLARLTKVFRVAWSYSLDVVPAECLPATGDLLLLPRASLQHGPHRIDSGVALRVPVVDASVKNGRGIRSD